MGFACGRQTARQVATNDKASLPGSFTRMAVHLPRRSATVGGFVLRRRSAPNRPSLRAKVAAPPSPVLSNDGNGPAKLTPEAHDALLRDNLPLAMALANTAFKSYKKPAGTQPFTDMWSNNTFITYTDNSYLDDRYAYVLEVKLKSGSKIPMSGLMDVPDPFIKLTLGGKEGQSWTVISSVKPNTSEPVWEETFCLCGRAQDLEALKLQVFDKDPGLLKDDILGEADVVAVNALQQGATATEFTVSLRKDKKLVPNATIKLSCRLTSFAEFGRYNGDTQPMTHAPLPQAWLEFLRSGAIGLPDDQYRDDYFLATKYTGVVEVQVQDASGLHPADLNGKADPFVELTVESEGEKWSATSSVKDATLKPDWSETFNLRIRKPDADVLRLKVWDKDWFGKEAMGEAVLRLDDLDLDDTAAQDFALELRLPKGQAGSRGTLNVRARLIGPRGFGQCDAEVMPAGVARPPIGPMTPVAYLDCKNTDTQAWLYCSEGAVKSGAQAAERLAILAFRGTEQTQLKDIVTDLRLMPTRLDEEAAASERNETFGVNSGNRNMMVHKGFRLAHDSVWDNVFALLKTVTGSGPRAPWKVVVTGHSLGGALATLASFKLAKSGVVSAVSMYTYGAPRVGNKAFADEFNGLVPEAWRFVNANDAVPRVPRLMGYCHVGTGVQLKEDSKPAIRNPEAAIEGKWMFEIGLDVRKSASEGDLEETLAAIRDPRRNFWTDLFSGAGIAQHMESFYVTHLRKALQSHAEEAEAQAD